MAAIVERSGGDELFALLQRLLPQHLLSRGMHRLARSRRRDNCCGALRCGKRADERQPTVFVILEHSQARVSAGFGMNRLRAEERRIWNLRFPLSNDHHPR